MSKRDDTLLLQDIYEAGVKILKYTHDYTFEDFISDERTVDAVIRNFEIMGEASKRLSEQVVRQYPEIEWRQMKSFRNLLIHGYFGINYRIVWDVIQKFLPQNVTLLNEILSS